MHDVPSTDLPLDPNVLQRRAADPESSVWVGASAGTGKTKVLTDRVLRLMLAGTPPERILCLTFTKAAAAEMSNRIAGRLSRWAVADDPALEKNLHDLIGRAPTGEEVTAARRLFARVLDAAGGMKIQTIHAFCQSLLRRFPLEAGLAPNFELMEDRAAADLLESARQTVLAAARREPDTPLGRAVADLAGTVSEDAFGELLRTIAIERARIRRILDHHGGLDPTVAAVWRFLEMERGTTEADIVTAFCADTAFDGDGLRAACKALAASSKTDGERGVSLQAWLDAAGKRMAGFLDYKVLFLTEKGEVRKTLLGKKAAEANPEALDALQREAQRLLDTLERLRCVGVATATESLLTLAEAMLEAYAAEKSTRALLDYDDLILTAARLLTDGRGACAWVLYKLDGGLDHVLIDEAQDTNPDQWRVVAAIVEEFFAGQGGRDTPPGRTRTLFVVGDDKQSIFSFQRADPAEFARMRRHFEAKVTAARQRWSGIDLQISFRSVGAVLKAVDGVFALETARDGVVQEGREVRHLPFRRLMAGRVELWPLAGLPEAEPPTPWSPPVERQAGEAPMARLALALADRIAVWLRDGERLEARDRPLRPGDIMVLVRRRNAFVTHLVRALKDRQVPVAGVDRMVLVDQLAVQDLMALGRFLLLPEDDLTLATVLKGPFIGFTEEELFRVAHGRAGHLWPSLSHVAMDAGGVFEAARMWLGGLLAETDFRTPFDLFADILSRPCPADPVSGRRAVLGRLGAEALDPLEEFLAAALAFPRDHVPSLEAFLHLLETSRAEVKRELDTGGGPAGGRVRIMTVHGSKGLQAPIVILPDTMGLPTQSPRILWPEMDGEDAAADPRRVPLYAPRRALEEARCRKAREAADQRRDREYRRLLYVALTRAEDRLIVCGWQDGRAGEAKGSWYRLTEDALSAIAEETDIDLTTVSPAAGWAGKGRVLWEPQVAPPKPDDQVSGTVLPAVELPDWARAPAPAEASPTRPLTPSKPEGMEPSLRSPLGGEDGLRFKRGTLIHKLLQVLPELPPERWDQAARSWLARPLHDLATDDQDEIAVETLRVLREPGFAALFAPGSRAEVPVVGIVGKRVLSGQIDRLAVTATEVLLVDYKTNRPPPRDPDDVPAIYLAQMAAYRAVLRLIYPDRAIRCLILWTDGPFTMELEPERLDRFDPDLPHQYGK